MGGLDAIASVDGEVLRGALAQDERAFGVSLLALVHDRGSKPAGARPTLDESYKRHARVLAQLAPGGIAADVPIVWDALWRLPPAMTWGEPGAEPWMRYPAVSFLAAARALPRA